MAVGSCTRGSQLAASCCLLLYMKLVAGGDKGAPAQAAPTPCADALAGLLLSPDPISYT